MKNKLNELSRSFGDEYVIYSVGSPPIFFTNKGIHGGYSFISWDNVEFCCTRKRDERDGDPPSFTVFSKVPWLDDHSFSLPFDYSQADLSTLEDKANAAYNVFMHNSGKANPDVHYNIIDNTRGFIETLKMVVNTLLFITIIILMYRELFMA